MYQSIVVNGVPLVKEQIEVVNIALKNLNIDLREQILYNRIIEDQPLIDEYTALSKRILELIV